ncbi:hypothetical protein BHE74_00003637 [Ensete ventricosum]|nr:hypothetical protein BHE74_00003637 [Ensete ventricosum]
MHLVVKEQHCVEYFLRFEELGHQLTIPCFFGALISGMDNALNIVLMNKQFVLLALLNRSLEFLLKLSKIS